ncbi:MAG: AI-2E family transporter [Owenweeksia sp.]|nr:AI-2E family transporter [Owenweeksia sp.]
MVLTGYLLILGRSLINPLITAFIIALIVKPMGSRMESWGFSRGLASVLSILIIFILLAGLSMFFSMQINNITNDLDTIGNRFSKVIDQTYQFIEKTLGVKPEEQTAYLKDGLQRLLENSSSFFQNTLSATAGFLTGFFLFLIGLFFMLYYRSFFVSFLYRSFKDGKHAQVQKTLYKVEGVVRSYILGLFLVISIIAVLNTLGLTLLGIEHAVFFGVLAALLTVIPYVGVFIGSLLPVIFALVTKDSLWYPLGVVLLFGFVQFLEGNFITPNVVGDKVSINPFAAIMSLFLGGLLLGTIGMIFAIPLLAIAKVICDSIESLKPIGYLLGSPPSKKARKFGKRGHLKR